MLRPEGMSTVCASEPHQLTHPCSTTAAPGSSNYDRPNRLKGREDGSIRWVELLEKFRSVQDRARRSQRQNLDGDDIPVGVSELRIGDGPLELRGKDSRPQSGLASAAQKDNAPAPPKKSTLGKQFGRLGGAMSNKGRKS